MSDSTNPKITITEEGQKSLRDFERKSGIEMYGLGYDRVKWENTLQKFAKMVAEHEREACAKLCDLAMLQNQEAINELEEDEHIAQCFIQGAMTQLVKTSKAIRARAQT
jgi:hypothetical protein